MITLDDPSQLSNVAEDLRRQAVAYTDVGNLLRAVELDTWAGQAADTYRERMAREPERWFDAAEALLDAARTLDVHAETVRWARARLSDASDLRRQAGAVGSPDLGATLDEEAQAIGLRVADAVDDSTWSVVCRLDGAAALAPSAAKWPASWWDHAWRAVANAGVDAVNAVASAGTAVAHHPGDAFGLVGGVALVDAGGSVFLASVAADATVVGAIVGVPVGIASATAAAAGGTLAVVSGGDLVMHARSDDARTPLHKLPEGERLAVTTTKGQVREGVPDPAPPRGAQPGWIKFRSDNLSGWVWQQPDFFRQGSAAGSQFRWMDPTWRYPNGYVRFTNREGQGLGLDGKPASHPGSHFELSDDGSYPTPAGW